jgi:transposase InsO family protein
MQQSIEEYVRCCDKCQMRKGKHEFRAPLGEVENPTEPFQVTAMDITGPYNLTPRKNKYLLTFICHFTRYVEAFPIPDVSAETCARVYATQIVARHGSGSTLITDQGSSFTAAFFRETCKILGVRKVRNSPYHPMSNGLQERVHRVLHDSIAHYIDSNSTNWDVVVPFFLMAYRATPHSTTGYSPFYLLHGREMVLPNEGDLKARVSPGIQDVNQVQRLENLKSSLRKAYKEVRINNRKMHQKNKAYYDKKAKKRTFEVNDKVFLFCPARKPGRCHKFRPFWQGPFMVVQKLSDLNYKIVDKKGKEFVVHVNRLKKSYDQTPWSFENTRRPRQKPRRPDTEMLEEDMGIQSRPIAISDEREPRVVGTQASQEERQQLERDSPAPGYTETPDADRDRRRQPPDSSVQDPDYEPSSSPRSRRELATTPIAPPITRSRARLQLQEDSSA